jgi:heme-degrading monooxygenase HmoA
VYATIRSYSGVDGLADALAGRSDDVRRIISEIDGFKAYYLLKTGDGAVSVSVFDSREGAEESARVAAGFLRDELPDIEVSAPQVVAGDVVVSA